ncbi:MAG: WG repeat-containing protein [Bacteroidota bacterium]
MKEEIKSAVYDFVRASYEGRTQDMVQALYPDDVDQFYQTMAWLMKAMEPFGEAEDFRTRLFPESNNLDEILALPPKVFMAEYLQRVMRRMDEKTLKKALATFEITQCEVEDNVAQVAYRLEVEAYGETMAMENQSMLTYEKGKWYSHLNPGRNAMVNYYQQKIEDYERRKSMDNIRPKPYEPDDLEPFALYGYKGPNEEIVIEPRFRHAGYFVDGLAPVQIFRKYGYLNMKGELAITPFFDKARDFSEGRAAVGKRDEELEMKWDYINRKGEQLTHAAYDEVSDFQEGRATVGKRDEGEIMHWQVLNLEGKVITQQTYDQIRAYYDGRAAVRKGDFWGFIDLEGQEVIPLKFEYVENFEFGTATVTLAIPGGYEDLEIDLNGEIVS